MAYAWLSTGNGSGIAAHLSEADLTKIVARTDGYSGSDMRNLIQEACQGPVRNAMARAAQESALVQLSEADLRPVVLKDFQVQQGLRVCACDLTLTHDTINSAMNSAKLLACLLHTGERSLGKSCLITAIGLSSSGLHCLRSQVQHHMTEALCLYWV